MGRYHMNEEGSFAAEEESRMKGDCPYLSHRDRVIPRCSEPAFIDESYVCPIRGICDVEMSNSLCEMGDEVLDILGLVPYHMGDGVIIAEHYGRPERTTYRLENDSIIRTNHDTGERLSIHSVPDLIQDLDEPY